MKDKIKFKYVNITVFCILSFCFYLIFKNVPLTSDDYIYIFSRLNGDKITNIFQAWNSFLAEYNGWSGRFAHFIDMLLLMSDGTLWRMITPILLSATPFVCFYFAKLRFPDKSSDYLSIAIVFTLLMTISDLYSVQMLYWHTACVTYFYFPLLLLVYLIPFRKSFEGLNEKKNISFAWTILMCVFALIMGISQEVVGAIAVAFPLSLIVYKMLIKEKIEVYEILATIFSLIGFVLLIKAPGNAFRLDYYVWWSDLTIFGKIKHGFGGYIFNQFHAQPFVIIMLFVSLVWQLKTKVKKIMILPIIAISALLLYFNLFEKQINWSVLEIWKYTMNYKDLVYQDILFSSIIYILITIFLIGLSIINSIQKNNPFSFVIISAIICTNLTTLFSPVATCYISFPGILLSFVIIIYYLPNFNFKSCIVVIIICFMVVIPKIFSEANKMKIAHEEENNRIMILQQATQNKLESVTIPPYSQRIWEGDIISDGYRKYYGISTELKINVE